MLNKLISKITAQTANMLYKVIGIGFIFQNGQLKLFIER